jgi:nitrate reductase alpha subunit
MTCSSPIMASMPGTAGKTLPPPSTTLPYTPAWAEKITGVSRDKIIHVAREFASNAEKTNGRSMIIIGAAMNHWYHADMNYRGVINMLVMCGCVGQSGGGWSHYVGQEKLRPQAGWAPLAFALDWAGRRASRTPPPPSMPTPTSGATRRWM